MSDEQHPDEDLLIAYVDDPAAYPEIAAHAEHCGPCREVATDHRNIKDALKLPETWWAEAAVSCGETRSAAMAYAARLNAEDEDAKRLLEPVLGDRTNTAYRLPAVTRMKKFFTGGVVRQLCEAVREECKREPRLALRLADAAQAIAEALPDNYYPAKQVYELRGNAWKEYATVCARYLGQFENGYDALRRADRAFNELDNPIRGLASVKLTRASLLWKQGRYEEALPLARGAAADYDACGLPLQYVEAVEIVAAIAWMMGDLATARETFKNTFELADTLDDPEMKARASKNLGLLFRDAGDFGNASKYLLMALQFYQGLENDALVDRVRWSIGKLALMAGNFRVAQRRLAEVHLAFDRKGMEGDAADVRLDLAEAHLLLCEFDEVEMLCAELVAVFHQQARATGALTAATFLHEAAQARRLERRDLDHVRRYLKEVQANSALVFAPPPEAPFAK
jgi:tetratricopeptide (TPR) repeat protein